MTKPKAKTKKRAKRAAPRKGKAPSTALARPETAELARREQAHRQYRTELAKADTPEDRERALAKYSLATAVGPRWTPEQLEARQRVMLTSMRDVFAREGYNEREIADAIVRGGYVGAEARAELVAAEQRLGLLPKFITNALPPAVREQQARLLEAAQPELDNIKQRAMNLLGDGSKRPDDT